MTNDFPYPGEVNPVTKGYQENVVQKIEREVPWTEPGLTIIRFRMLTDPGFPMYDVSYCHGMIDGEPVEVRLPFSQLPKRGWKRAVVKYAIKDGVHAKSLGIFDNFSTLT